MAGQFLDFALVVTLLFNFLILGTSRLNAAIYMAAIQGAVLGVLPLLVHQENAWRALPVAAITISLRAIVLPKTMFFALRQVEIRREIEPILGMLPSLILGAVGTALALIFASRLPLLAAQSELVVPAAISTVWTAVLMLTTRRKAITQVLGYLLLENGIFLFGLLLFEAVPLLVEAGVLLDLFVCVFVMGIIIQHIHREFDSHSTHLLSSLKEH